VSLDQILWLLVKERPQEPARGRGPEEVGVVPGGRWGQGTEKTLPQKGECKRRLQDARAQPGKSGNGGGAEGSLRNKEESP